MCRQLQTCAGQYEQADKLVQKPKQGILWVLLFRRVQGLVQFAQFFSFDQRRQKQDTKSTTAF
jgi:hypothetical protein